MYISSGLSSQSEMKLARD
uniref:Uncharacterized protein n=1 Tax=Anguilla anguilla TaxID=7936 RepID=A0A0E9RHJ3_ANGAN